MANRERIKAVLEFIGSMADGEKLFLDMSVWAEPAYKFGAGFYFATRKGVMAGSAARYMAMQNGIEACGTAMCFAGWSVFHEDMVVPDTSDNVITLLAMTIPDQAQQYLGLTRDQADKIFSATDCDTVDKLRVRISNILYVSEGRGLD